jgi:hypothetical protein
VVRRDDDLVGLSRVVENESIAGAARWSLIVLVADVARSDSKLAERSGDTPREQLIEQQPDGGSPRRGAPS